MLSYGPCISEEETKLFCSNWMDFLFFSVCVPVSLITTPSNCPLLGKNLLPGPLTPCCQIPARLFPVARSRPAYFLLPDPSALTPCCQISAPLFQVTRSQPAYSLLPDPSPLTPCCQIPARLLLVARSRAANTCSQIALTPYFGVPARPFRHSRQKNLLLEDTILLS